MAQSKSPTVLIILDGYGIAEPSKANAITLAKKPTIDRLFELYPHTQLGATGKDVGLEDNKMSGSEAGHMNIGAGRVVKQDSWYITESIKDGSFFMNPVLSGAVHHVLKHKSKFHVMGLMGNEDSPHSDPRHFRAILKLAKKGGIEEVYCHLFADGRDSFPKSALTHLRNFQKIMKEEGIGKIASISGRFYAMDRAKNWDRLTMAYETIVFGKGRQSATAEEAIEHGYRRGRTDEFIKPTVICENGEPIAKLGQNDSMVFFNLRSDRARQFTKLFVATNKENVISDDMPVLDKIKNLYFVALTDFGPDLDVHTVWLGQAVSGTLPIAMGRLSQLYIAETEKFAHITYFLNGGYADPVNGEERFMVPSPVIDSYAKMPQMAAHHIKDKVMEGLENESYDFYALNFANPDMVGHTGDLKATVRAIEFVDEQIKTITEEVLKRDGNIIITADHGNAECMFDFKENQPNTFHTKNPVPFLLAGEKFKNKKLSSGGVLGNIAPTVLSILEVDKPNMMRSDSLLK